MLFLPDPLSKIIGLYLALKDSGHFVSLRTPQQEVSDEGATQAQIDLSVEEPVGHM